MLLAFILLTIVVLLVGQFVRDDNGRQVATSAVASAPGVQPNAGIGQRPRPPRRDRIDGTGHRRRCDHRAGGATGTAAARPRRPPRRTPPTPARPRRPRPVRSTSPAASARCSARPARCAASRSRSRRRMGRARRRLRRARSTGSSATRAAGSPAASCGCSGCRGRAAADFTVYLATPATSERMCAAGGLDTERYTSCRLPGQVIINLARWLTAVPGLRRPAGRLPGVRDQPRGRPPARPRARGLPGAGRAGAGDAAADARAEGLRRQRLAVPRRASGTPDRPTAEVFPIPHVGPRVHVMADRPRTSNNGAAHLPPIPGSPPCRCPRSSSPPPS